MPAPARIGAVAPVDVFVEPGPTGCDPGQTAWFQALNIPTKINKGQIEMISRVHLIKAGNKVTDSQAALLQKLSIRPFSYGLVVTHVYDNGAVFEIGALDVTPEELMAKFMGGVSTFAAVSLALGLPNKATAVHSINDALKALLAIGMGTDYKFPKAAEFESFLANASNFVAAAPAAGAAAGGAAKPKVEEKKEEEEEEEVGGAGGLFGDDDDVSGDLGGHSHVHSVAAHHRKNSTTLACVCGPCGLTSFPSLPARFSLPLSLAVLNSSPAPLSGGPVAVPLLVLLTITTRLRLSRRAASTLRAVPPRALFVVY